MDPSFEYGVALAQIGGRLVLRLANADRLPIEFASLATTVGGYVGEVEELADTMREETTAENERIEKGYYALAWDPEDRWTVPSPELPAPHLNFAPLQNALSRLSTPAPSVSTRPATTPRSRPARRRSSIGRSTCRNER